MSQRRSWLSTQLGDGPDGLKLNRETRVKRSEIFIAGKAKACRRVVVVGNEKIAGIPIIRPHDQLVDLSRKFDFKGLHRMNS